MGSEGKGEGGEGGRNKAIAEELSAGHSHPVFVDGRVTLAMTGDHRNCPFPMLAFPTACHSLPLPSAFL